MSIISNLIRSVFKNNDNKRDSGLCTPEDIYRYDDICYGPDQKWNVLDVYRPKAAEGALPVIISVHGGGWVYGDKERYQYYCMSLAQQGFAVGDSVGAQVLSFGRLSAWERHRGRAMAEQCRRTRDRTISTCFHHDRRGRFPGRAGASLCRNAESAWCSG